MDDEDRIPDLPLGKSWRFGLGARYDWPEKLEFGSGYTLLWSGDPYLIRYNSRMTVVVYVPEDVEVRYRIWTTGAEIKAMRRG